MALKTSKGDENNLVQRYINTSYDIVKTVADNISSVTKLAASNIILSGNLDVVSQVLVDGQFIVVFTESINPATFYVLGDLVDTGLLEEGIDFTRDSVTKTITLTQSYPAGTRILMSYGTDIPVVSINDVLLFNTVGQMKASTAPAGQSVETQGYYAAGDSGNASYFIKSAADYGATPDEYGDHTLANGNIAVLQTSSVIILGQFGASPMRTAAQNSAPMQAAFDALPTGGEFYVTQAGVYQFDTALTWIRTDTTDTNTGITIKGVGRRTSTLKYTGTSGFGITIKGTTLDLTRNGLIEGITFKDIGYKGTGKASGNTDSGLYIQAFNHFILDNALITDFGQDCLHLDRLFYNLSPDVGKDDRGAFVHLKDSEISFAGRHNLIAGGINSADDYSIDHLTTENMHIVNAGNVGAKIYANNYTDISSIFHGDVKCMELYAQNSNILTQNVTMNSPRFEGGQSDCMLDMISCLSAVLINPFFAGHAGLIPAEQVRIADDANYNVGSVEFKNPIFQQATTAVNVVGTGNVLNVRIIDPTYNTITNEVLNATNKPIQMIKGGVLERITGGGACIALEGAAGNVMTSKLDGDSASWLALSNSGKTISLGNGSGVVDTSIKRLNVTTEAAMSCTTHFSVQETQAAMYSGTGTPEGNQVGAVGSTYTRTDGGAGTSFYVKESGGVGNTGWVGK